MGTARFCVICGTSLRARPKDEIQADLAMARALGVNTTPFILVNGRPFMGSAALQQITSVVADELRRAKVPAATAVGAAAKPVAPMTAR